MKRVFKYALPHRQKVLRFPAGARVLLVGHQGNVPTIWLEVETENMPRDRDVVMVPTGGEVPELREHIGSYQNDLGNVWHLYW